MSLKLSTLRHFSEGRDRRDNAPLDVKGAAHRLSRMSLWTSLWTWPTKKKSTFVVPEDGQGLRSRGVHEWPPCLEGPDTFTDTMDVAGPLGSAWMRLCLFPDRVRRPS